MTEAAPQSLTLSLRISEALRKRLDHLRQLVTLRTGENVSTSEVAKQLLEAAQGEGLEVVEFLREPAKSLLRIRKKCEERFPLSRAEWTTLAHFVQQGQEAFPKNPISRESCIAILQAFQEVYELKTKPSHHDKYYLSKLPRECRPKEGKQSDTEMVQQTVAEALRQLKNPATKWRPDWAARPLYVFLDNDEISSLDALNEALYPYWRRLWRVAARGHFAVTGKPVREENPDRFDPWWQPQPLIPTLRESNYSLSFVRNQVNELNLLLIFPGPCGAMYPMGPYPMIVEFRGMVDELGKEGRSWIGERFFGYVSQRDEETEYWFRANNNGITFGFTEQEWKAVGKLFRKAWELPEVQAAWDALTLEYGEL